MRRQLAQQQEVARQNAEEIEELEEYVKIQETYFAEQIVTKDMLLTKLNEKHSREQEEWTSAKTTLEQRCFTVEPVSEQRRLELLVVQAKLMQNCSLHFCVQISYYCSSLLFHIIGSHQLIAPMLENLFQ